MQSSELEDHPWARRSPGHRNSLEEHGTGTRAGASLKSEQGWRVGPGRKLLCGQRKGTSLGKNPMRGHDVSSTWAPGVSGILAAF